MPRQANPAWRPQGPDQGLTPLQQQEAAINSQYGGVIAPPAGGGGGSSTGGGTSTSTTTQGFTFDPRVGAAALPQGIYGAANRAYVRDVQNPELARNQLTEMLRSGSSYIQNARSRGREEGANRGLGVFGGMSAGFAERAAIDSAAPIALSDAEAYRQAASENLQWLNQMQIASEQNRDIGRGHSGPDAEHMQRLAQEHDLQMQRERLAYEGEQRGLDRNYGAYSQDRGFQHERFTQAADQRWQRGMQRERTSLGLRDYAARTGIDLRAQSARFHGDLLNAMLNAPDVYTPEVVAGMSQFGFDTFNDYGELFDQWFDQFDFMGGW